ncbi:MAG: hypothetical protein IJU77_06875 [Butyrivibrio sp.]|nr:hypothetical protein [Butyrivibrio sp.]
MADRKKALLEKLEVFYKEDDSIEEASLFTGEELGTQMDILRLLIRDYGPGLMDVLAEFSFLPTEGDEVWFFNAVITILTDVPKEAVPALSGAISRLNFYLPYGAFCISADGSMLAYKASTALMASHDDEKIYENLEAAAETALLVPEQYTFSLEQIVNGKLLMNDFIKMLPQ